LHLEIAPLQENFVEAAITEDALNRLVRSGIFVRRDPRTAALAAVLSRRRM